MRLILFPTYLLNLTVTSLVPDSIFHPRREADPTARSRHQGTGVLLVCVEDTPQRSLRSEHHSFCIPGGDELLLEGVAEGARINSCLGLRDPLIFCLFWLLEDVCVICYGNGHMIHLCRGVLGCSTFLPSMFLEHQQGEVALGRPGLSSSICCWPYVTFLVP